MSQREQSDKQDECSDERLLGLFTVSGIAPSTVWTLPNQYWPDTEHYADVRRKNPWLLVKTKWGLIQLGWRKRVIEIDWSDTPIRGEVTPDDVTKVSTMVHAYSYEKALTYLSAWKKLAEAHDATITPSSTSLTPAIQELIDHPIRQGRSTAYAHGVYDARFGGDRNYTDYRDRQEYLQGTRDGAVREALIKLKERGSIAPSANGLTLDSDARRVIGALLAYAGDERGRKFNGHTDWIPLDLNDLDVLRRLLARDDIQGQQR